jgi:hypothetical protein
MAGVRVLFLESSSFVSEYASKKSMSIELTLSWMRWVASSWTSKTGVE